MHVVSNFSLFLKKEYVAYELGKFIEVLVSQEKLVLLYTCV